MRQWALTLGLLACSSAPPPPPAPTSCDPATQWRGTYLLHADYVSGNCGAQADGLVILDANGPPPQTSACTISGLRYQGNCRIDIQESCPSGSTVETLTQQTQDGSVLKGEISITTPRCFGTYVITYTRQ